MESLSPAPRKIRTRPETWAQRKIRRPAIRAPKKNLRAPQPESKRAKKSNRASPLCRRPPRASRAPASAFDEFWRQYPLKKEKRGAYVAFQRAVKDGATTQEIIAGAMRYAAERMGQEPKYTKHPTTWLNKGCWSDEPSPSAGRSENRNSAVVRLLKMGGVDNE